MTLKYVVSISIPKWSLKLVEHEAEICRNYVLNLCSKTTKDIRL